MLYVIAKVALAALIVAVVSVVARRHPGAGGLIASLPLIPALGMIWLWRDTKDPVRMAAHAQATFWVVLPPLPMFLLIPYLLRHGLSFWLALAPRLPPQDDALRSHDLGGPALRASAVILRLAMAAGLLGLAGIVSAQTAPPANAWRCGPEDMPELCRMMAADQSDRTAPIDWAATTPRDRERRRATLAIVRTRPLRTSGDYFHAALIMQHGETWEDYAAAHLLAARGLQLAPEDRNLQRMTAAAWDRMMHAMGHGQWFGTNSFSNPDGSQQARGTRPDLLPRDMIESWSQGWVWPEE